MQKYTGTKTVEAFKIHAIQAVDYGLAYKLIGYYDETFTKQDIVEVRTSYYEKHKPEVDGYYVRYVDGYESFSPAEAFEAAYKPAQAIHPAPVEFTEQELKDDAILRYFHYSHLPPKLQEISKPFCDVAKNLIGVLPRNAERSAGLRKLLEAKDCMVRANI